MPLGTLDRAPPPFFRQGPTARTKLIFCSALALFLMVADARFRVTQPLREALNLVLLPVQHGLAVPIDMLRSGGDYLQGLHTALANEARVRIQLTRQSELALRADTLTAENQQLRGLLELRLRTKVRAIAAEVMYDAADPYSRKFFLDAGSTRGIQLGSPVINEQGVLGQVTRVYALASEVTLLADKDAAIPVLNVRTQQRSAAFGGVYGGAAVSSVGATIDNAASNAANGAASGAIRGSTSAPKTAPAAVMELRFMSGNADVQVGDTLHTSGVDGVYPPGLPVARVVSVERRVESSFARVLLSPAAAPDAVRHVLVLEPVGVQLPPRPAPDAPPAPRARKGAKAATAAGSSNATTSAATSPASAALQASGARP